MLAYVLAYAIIVPKRNHYSSAQHLGLIGFAYYRGKCAKSSSSTSKIMHYHLVISLQQEIFTELSENSVVFFFFVRLIHLVYVITG